MKVEIKGLHPLEVKLLLHFKDDEEIISARVLDELSFNLGQCNQAFSWLSAKELIKEKRRGKRLQFILTESGKESLEKGPPEERIFNLIKTGGPLTLPEISKRLALENRDAGSAFGSLSRARVLAMDGKKQVIIRDASGKETIATLKRLLSLFARKEVVEDRDLSPGDLESILGLSRKRGAGKGLFRASEKEEVSYIFTPAGSKARTMLLKQGLTGEEIGQITPDILRNGVWKNSEFRGYNINIPPSRVLLGRKNPYVEFLEQLKNKLTSLGFVEFDGPLLETEFWNSDALFMPQFHSARDIHDVYYVKEPSHAGEIEQPYLDQVAAAHENGWETGSLGWRYAFDRLFTRRMILRSHGTVLSAKTLPEASVPGKYFGVVRCFRYDRVDATHLADFYQTEGIVLGEEVNLRTLLGLLKMFAEEVAGAREVKYVPGYFPFTEPSVEVHIKHSELGWFELGGSGIFRPEVTEPLGVKVPVLAWGLGIDRMALMALGLNDLRDLFTNDVEQVRLRRRR